MKYFPSQSKNEPRGRDEFSADQASNRIPQYKDMPLLTSLAKYCGSIASAIILERDNERSWQWLTASCLDSWETGQDR